MGTLPLDEIKSIVKELLKRYHTKTLWKRRERLCGKSQSGLNIFLKHQKPFRKKLLQKRLAMGHKQGDHEEMQNYGQSIQ